jgi:hypothetical protein
MRSGQFALLVFCYVISTVILAGSLLFLMLAWSEFAPIARFVWVSYLLGTFITLALAQRAYNLSRPPFLTASLNLLILASLPLFLMIWV